jgi:hypothetical protein
MSYSKGWQIFCVRRQKINILGFVEHALSGSLMQLLNYIFIAGKQPQTIHKGVSVAVFPAKLYL